MNGSLNIRSIHRAELNGNHLLGSEPLVISECLENWPAMQLWTPSSLGKLVSGKVDIKVSFKSFRNLPDNTPADPEERVYLSNIEFEQAAKEIIASDGTGAKYYISQQDIVQRLPELIPHIKFVWPVSSAKAYLWFGTNHIITPLHYDHRPNLFAQIYGIKKITLFSPEDTEYLYPYPDDAKVSHLSHVNVENPDLVLHPKFADARRYSFEIFPGQVLFLPPFWWHHVESLSTSISVNQWTDLGPEFAQFRGAMATKWARLNFAEERWQRFYEKARLTIEDVLAGCIMLLDTNPQVALLAAVALATHSSVEAVAEHCAKFDIETREHLVRLAKRELSDNEIRAGLSFLLLGRDPKVEVDNSKKRRVEMIEPIVF